MNADALYLVKEVTSEFTVDTEELALLKKNSAKKKILQFTAH